MQIGRVVIALRLRIPNRTIWRTVYTPTYAMTSGRASSFYLYILSVTICTWYSRPGRHSLFSRPYLHHLKTLTGYLGKKQEIPRPKEGSALHAMVITLSLSPLLRIKGTPTSEVLGELPPHRYLNQKQEKIGNWQTNQSINQSIVLVRDQQVPPPRCQRMSVSLSH